VLVTEPVPFAEYIDSVMEPFKNYAGGLSFEQAEPDREFLIDKLRIRLLMTNLLNNGIRHGENNPILVKVSFEEENAILEVRDQGEGIEEKHLSQISEPFYRADSSRQRNTGGFGLGLYLCRLIAAAHGGELKIESELGEGTHITVRIPQHPPRLEPEPEWNDS